MAHTHKLIDGIKVDLTAEEIAELNAKDEIENKKIADAKVIYDANQYQRDRATAYPSIQEQLDLQYWDKVNGTTNWENAIAKVKSDNPKD
jgi:hypothetical protein